jgi:plasmid stability protein
MRQLLLRVPDDLHRRIAARAAREGMSVNQLASDILDAAADADRGGRRSRLRAQAAASGVHRPVLAADLSASDRRRALESMKGIGPVLDEELAADRDRA